MKTTDIHIRDPYILPLPDEGRYLLFGTTGKNAWAGPGLGFDCYESRDLENWTGPTPAFRPSADFWSNTQFWAPECHPWQGRYFLFASFAKNERQRGTQILVADKPEGPYHLHSDGPVTPRDWECLDGTLFVDDAGSPWMVFCHEWVQVEDGEICALPLTADLRAATGEPTLLFRASEAAWAKPFESHGRAGNRVTDGPFLHRLADGQLLMLWSTLAHEGYAMGYAVSDSGNVLGPWRQSDAPIYGRDGGHGMLFRDFNGQLWMSLHHPNNSPNERPLWLEVAERCGGLALKQRVSLPETTDDFHPLSTHLLETYVASFNRNDQELYRQYIPNDRVAAWMSDNIPLFECPDKEIEEIYYFRWWTFRKHLKETPDGFVVTEFLPPVPWAGKHNTISCAAAHHFREGRWLHDTRYLDDYARFWLRGGGEARTRIATNRGYSFWIADSLLAQARVTGRFDPCLELLPDLIANYEGWEREQRDPNGLFWQRDDRDGMEYSISGKLAPNQLGYRVTINSYMYGDALAIAEIAERAGYATCATRFRGKAAEIKRLTQEHLWDAEARFFKVLPRFDNPTLSDARELHGYTPWYFNLPDPDKSAAWAQLMDPKGFYAPFGPTTAEQRHPEFAVIYTWKCCQWNGPSWPFSTSVTLTGLANLLNDYTQDTVTRQDYFEILKIYTRSHRLRLDDGREVPWIDENLQPLTGDWLTRTAKKHAIGKADPGWADGAADPAKLEERGKDYNHSTYCDLIINGLAGLRPQSDERLVVSPLIPEDWDYFCLDRVRYHGRDLTVLYDRTGEKYGRGRGLRLYCDGREVAGREALSPLAVDFTACVR